MRRKALFLNNVFLRFLARALSLSLFFLIGIVSVPQELSRLLEVFLNRKQFNGALPASIKDHIIITGVSIDFAFLTQFLLEYLHNDHQSHSKINRKIVVLAPNEVKKG